MDRSYWLKQAPGEPLFPDILWSRPENKMHAGKLLIIGGHAESFAAPAEAYGEATKAGVGTAHVLLPDALQKTVGQIFPTAEFCKSNPSGGFAQTCLGEMLAMAEWADGVLLAGDFGRNSETAILLEKFTDKYTGQITLTKDAVDYFTAAPQQLLQRENSTLVLSFAQLQKLAISASFHKAFTFDIDMLRLVETLHEFTEKFQINIVTKHLDNIFASAAGRVSSTRIDKEFPIWRVKAASSAAVWWLQNPAKPFEALTTSLAGSSLAGD